ncbi:pectate lyase [Caulobacter segnis]|uniref:pectate lyase family protein n=1 Tax=Caulobacter segnis TaxID=88688 RepID=UPI00240EDB9B|nr:pectate lyase [Caulobacter segnis]MDG2520344.1 pectate lyase [Caulobacter segnis]
MGPCTGRISRRTFTAAVFAAAAVSTAAAASEDDGFTRTRGGEGGRRIVVTTLANEGPGSLRAALKAKGPRIISFAVGGVIDLGRKTLQLREPFVTIDGEGAPSPGVTLIRGDLAINTHDVIVRHIRVRAGRDGAPDKSGYEVDGISLRSARDVIIDHCSISWATDENLSASGPRFEGGEDVAGWRAGTSRRVTFSNNIVSEGLSNASHVKGEHSKGSLIHDNATGILIVGNLYAHNLERNQLFKGGVHAVSVNNLIYDPGTRAMHYALNASEWVGHPWQVGQLVLVGNVLKGGRSTRPDLPFLIVEGQGDLELFAKDNLAHLADGRVMAPLRILPTEPLPKVRPLAKAPFWPSGLKAIPASQVETKVLARAGARPWDRDATDLRVVRQVKDGTGRVIDDEAEVGGYPKRASQ